MPKNKFFTLLLITIISVSCILFCGFDFLKNKSIKTKEETVYSKQIKEYNPWCITFQLVWNEVLDYLGKDKIEFIGGNPPLADELNKKLYTKDDISPDSYYITYGEISQKLKKEIEKSISEKFNEKSDILNQINWNIKNGYLFYSMLKKNFNFPEKFDVLKKDAFENKGMVKYFGKDESTKNSKIKENIKVLFYNNENEYAISLKTKEKEDVILLRTQKNDSFENLYSYIEKNRKFDTFSKLDTLKVPFIKVDKVFSYNQLCNKRIKGTNFLITQAIQTIKFNMDNKGGTLKSEAAIAMMKTALAPNPEKPRHFNFDKRFVLFLKESSKDKPYFAMKVYDDTFLVK